ncbi:hypothetical protein Y032_0441g1514 [Ancylostoma ceylanicum]|uniref:Uncharacterized protein n=1 Tax=Ancylostoma ceylanicum TaxID=53326 RepID=A0A016X1D4_9BILA|nr:hypothetical protein Y032_0441g1514 [Ancylostoma ceylanicum]
MALYLVVLSLLLLTHVSDNCVPTQSTTTPVCCPLLSQTTLPRRAPSSTAFQQCSILRRVSSNCPVDGFVFCDAAPETNPTTMQIEFFNSTGNVVRTIQRTGTTLTVRVFCFNGQWWVRTAAAANTNVTINTGIRPGVEVASHIRARADPFQPFYHWLKGYVDWFLAGLEWISSRAYMRRNFHSTANALYRKPLFKDFQQDGQVSCSQTGSTGTDQGYVVGTALD